jgi:NADH-quinone oxidoreductase subunit G
MIDHWLQLIREIAQQTGATTLNVSATSNSIAAEMANFVPGQGGLNANAMLAADLSAYILLEVYPQYDPSILICEPEVS